MPDPTLLDRGDLESTFDKYQAGPVVPPDLPNIGYQGISMPAVGPLYGGPGDNADLSPLDAYENNINKSRNPDRLTGGSISRSLAESQSDRFNNFLPNYNNEDAYAQGQGWASKMVNGIGKGLALTGTTFLQSTLGLVNGVGNAIADGRAASFYDNEFNRSLDEFNKRLENSLPNYYTDAERNARWYSPTKLFTANFLWDGIVKNLGFAAGAALSGGAFTAALKAIPLTARLFSIGKAAEALQATEVGLATAGKAAETFGKIKTLSDKFLKSYSALNTGGRVLVSGLATTGEAGFEAFHNLNEYRDGIIEEYKKEHGGAMPTGEEMAQINQLADKVGNGSFILNTMLLTATNYIQFPKILGSSYKAEKGIINGLKKEISDVAADATGKFALAAAPTTRFGKILSKANKIRPYTYSIPEGFEEGAQFAISVGTKDYYNKKYEGANADFFSSLGAGIKGTIGSDEGMESILIGGLSGAIMTARGRYSASRDKTLNTNSAIAAFNRKGLSDFTRDTADSVARGTAIQQDREALIRQGDVLESKDKEADYIINYLTPRIKYGRTDLVTSDIETARNLAATEEGFAQLIAEGKVADTDTREAYLKRINSLEATAKNVESLYQSLNLRYSGAVDKDGKAVYAPEVIDQMIYAASKVQDYDGRIRDLSTALAPAGIAANLVINDMLKGNYDTYNAAFDSIDTIQGITIDQKEDLRTQFQDMAELTLRREQFLTEYEDLKKVPKKYTEAREIVKTDATPKNIDPKTGEVIPETIKITTKTGDKDIEIGTEYFVGLDVQEDVNGKEVYSASRLTVLGENEDGTIQIKDNKGVVRNISKAILEGYKLGKMSEITSDKTKAYFVNHRNSVFEFNFGKNDKGNKRGRLSYEGGKLYFNYMHNGKREKLQLFKDHFVAGEGFKKARLIEKETLTAVTEEEKEAKRLANEEFLAAEEDAKLTEKRNARLAVVAKAAKEIQDRIEQIKKNVTRKSEKLKDINEELEKLKGDKIVTTPKGGRASSYFGKVKAAKIFNTVPRTIMDLSKLKEQAETSITALTAEQEELEFNLGYIEDFAQTLGELPDNGAAFTKELQDQVDWHKELIKESTDNILGLQKIITGIDGAIKDLFSFLKSTMASFNDKYPDYMQAGFQRIADGGGIVAEIPQVKEYLADLAFTTDIQKEITTNKEKIDEVVAKIDVIAKDMEGLQRELEAKELILDRFKEAIQIRETKQKEEAAVLRTKEIQDMVFGESKKATAAAGTNNGDFEDGQADVRDQVTLDKEGNPESKKVAADLVFSTTAEASEDWNSADAERQQAFLSKAAAKADLPPNKGRLVGRIISVKNEAAYGLKGLGAKIAGKFKEWGTMSEEEQQAQLDDADITPLVQVYVVEKDGKLFFANEEGEATDVEFKDSPEGDIDLDTIMYSTLRGTTGLNSKGESIFRAEQEEEGQKQLTAYRENRKKMIDSKNAIPTTLAVSRGLPIYDEVVAGPEEGKINLNTIEETLMPESEQDELIHNNGIIMVADSKSVIHNKAEIITKPGRVYFKHRDKFAPLTNRNLNEQEQDILFKSLYWLAYKVINSKGWDKQIERFIRGLVYYAEPKQLEDGSFEKIGRNQIWVDSKWKLNMGVREEDGKFYPARVIDFTPSSFEDNKELIKGYLKGAYNNVNSHYIKSNENHYEIVDFDSEGNAITVTDKDGKKVPHRTYQHYLIAKGLVQSPLRKLSLGRNFKQKYVIFKTPEAAVPKAAPIVKASKTATAAPKATKKAAAPTPGKAPVTSAAALVNTGFENNGTVNTFQTLAGELIEFTYTDPFKDLDVLGTPDASAAINRLMQNTTLIEATMLDPKLAGLNLDTEEKAAQYLIRNAIIGAILKDAAPTSTPAASVVAANQPMFDGNGTTVNTLKIGNGEIISFTFTDPASPDIVKDEEFDKAVERLKKDKRVTSVDTDDQAIARIRQKIEETILKERGSAPATIQVNPGVSNPPVATPKLSLKGGSRTAFSEVNNFEVERMDEAERTSFKAWMAKNLPQFSIEFVEHLINIVGDRRAWGSLTGDVITLFETGKKGTGYHEAFEGVWKYFVTPEEQDAIHVEFNSRKGEFLDRTSNRLIPYAEASLFQAKEAIADMFGDKLTGKKLSLSDRIAKFFQDIVNFFKYFGKKKSLIDDLFSKIEKGTFAKRKLPTHLDESSEYSRVPGFTMAQTRGMVEDMTRRFFKIILSTDIFEREYQDLDVFGAIREEYGEKFIDSLVEKDTTWRHLIEKTKQKLATHRIVYEEDVSHKSDKVVMKEDKMTINDEGANRNDYADDRMTTDVKKSSPYPIKFLLSSLVEVEGPAATDGEFPAAKESPVIEHGIILVPFNRAFIQVMQGLSGSVDITDMINKLKVMSIDKPEYVRLFASLNAGQSSGDFDFENLTEANWRMLTAFFHTFNKQKPDTSILVTEGNSKYFQNAHLGNTTTTTRNFWISNIRSIGKAGTGYIAYDKKAKAYIMKKGETISISGEQAQLDFLAKLGILFTKTEYDMLDNKQKIEFEKAVGKIKNFLITTPIKSLTSKSLGINGSINALAELYVKKTRTQFESSFRNLEGKQQQVFVQQNVPSQFEHVFNHVTHIDELRAHYPQLNDVYATNSEVLRLGGVYFKADGVRTDNVLKVGYINGQEVDKRTTSITKMSLRDRLMTQINGLMTGLHYISVPADGSTEWNLSIENFVSMNDLLNNSTIHLSKMVEYLEDEIRLAIDNRDQLDNVGTKASKLRFFEEILTPTNLKAVNAIIASGRTTGTIDTAALSALKLEDNFKAYLNLKKATLRASMKKESLFYIKENGDYEVSDLIRDEKEKNSYTPKEFDDLLEFIAFNYFYGQTEIHKLIIGDPFSFKMKEEGLVLDLTKRVKALLGPATPSIKSDYFNRTFSKVFNVVSGMILNDRVPGYVNVKDYVRSATIADINIVGVNSVTGYDKVNEADATGIHTIMMEMQIMARHGKLSTAAKAWYEYEMAYTRNAMNKKGQFPDSDYPSVLRKADELLLQKPRPEYVFNVSKPIVRGNKYQSENNDLVIDKFSSYPLWYSAVEGKNLENLFVKMFKEQIDYIVVESGRKVGAQGTHQMYNKNGTFNETPFNTDQVVDIDWGTYYIQVENAYSEGKKQTRGSQLAKLFAADFYNQGEIQGKTPEDKAKALASIRRNDSALEELTRIGYKNLLTSLGIKDNGTRYEVTDPLKLRDTLRKEAEKRDMPDNIRQMFNNPNIPLDASSEYLRIQNMLFSMVDKAIVHPKVNGGSYVQISALLWEDAATGRKLTRKVGDNYIEVTREDYDNMSPEMQKTVKLTSTALKWYTKEEPWMEVMLPQWFGKKLMKETGFKTEAELIAFLDTPEGNKLLTGLGFRIPTSGMSSIEVFKVKGFLPAEFGTTIVVPSEITTKSGSDFDIDKLNLYLKSAFMDKGKLKQIPFLGYGDAAIAEFNKILTANAWAKKQESKAEVLDKLHTEQTDLDLNAEEEAEDEVEAAKNIQAAAEVMYKKSIENEYYESMIDTVQNASNFEQWMRPLDSPVLKDLAKEIAGYTGTAEQTNLDRVLDITYMVNLRNAFLTAKNWISVGAVNITGHAQGQRVDLHLDTKRVTLSKDDRDMLGKNPDTILLDHNKNKDGKVSLSHIQDATTDVKKKNNISDVLNWFMNSFVDVAKDPYITNIITSDKSIGTFMFLIRAGVPTKQLALFMNQPIIREFLHFSDLKGYTRFAPYMVKEFYDEGYYPKASADKKLKIKDFESNIKRYYSGETFNSQDLQQQSLVLNEFLKYFKMAEHSFNFTSATKWDTANFRTSGSVMKMENTAVREQRDNIWSTPEKVLSSTNNGNIRRSLNEFRGLLGNFFATEATRVKSVLDQVLRPYATTKAYISDRDFDNIDNKITSTFIDYLLKDYVSSSFRGLVVNDNRELKDAQDTVAETVKKIKESPELMDAYQDNIFFNYIRAEISDLENGAHNLRLSPLPKEVYDKDSVTDGLREMKELELENGIAQKDSLYSKIVQLAIIQGSGNMTNLQGYIPIEDMAPTISRKLAQLPTNHDIQEFADLHLFQKTNWKDDSIVPTAGARARLGEMGLRRRRNTVFGPRVITVSTQFDKAVIDFPIIKMQRWQTMKHSKRLYDMVEDRLVTVVEMDTARKQADKSGYNHIGYQKVMNGDKPLVGLKGKDIVHYYKQINLYGDENLQEFNLTGLPSRYDNKTIHIETPLSDEEIIRELVGKALPSPTNATMEERMEEVEPENQVRIIDVADFNKKTPIEGLNERLLGLGELKLALPKDYFEGPRPAGRLNAFKDLIRQAVENIQSLKDQKYDEFVSAADNAKLKALAPKAARFSEVNMLVSGAEFRTVALEQEYADLTREIYNAYMDIINPYIKSLVGKGPLTERGSSFEDFKDTLKRKDCK